MTDGWLTGTTISKTFFTLVLLTRSSQRAEAAMLEAIDTLNSDAEREEALFRLSVAAALQGENRLPAAPRGEREAALSMLPARLRPVLNLAPNLRHCFVMNLLAGIPIKDCAVLLGLHVDQIEQFLCSALTALSATSARPANKQWRVGLRSAVAQ